MLTFFSLHSNYSFQLHKMKAWRKRTKRHQPTARRHQSAIFWLQIYAELSENHVFRVLYYTNYGLKACFLSLFSDLINLGNFLSISVHSYITIYYQHNTFNKYQETYY